MYTTPPGRHLGIHMANAVAVTRREAEIDKAELSTAVGIAAGVVCRQRGTDSVRGIRLQDQQPGRDVNGPLILSEA